MDGFDCWRLCDELTIDEAANLQVGMRPTDYDLPENAFYELTLESYKRYIASFTAVRTAIATALRLGNIDGQVIEVIPSANEVGDVSKTPEMSFTVDTSKSIVKRDSLITWLRARGVTTGFFFPGKTDVPGYLDPNNPRYAPKLAASVSAWIAVTDPGKKSPKQALDRWLREHDSSYGMTNDEGKPIELAISDCSKVANWQQSGGAPKSPGN